jgi:hypothetical protein
MQWVGLGEAPWSYAGLRRSTSHDEFKFRRLHAPGQGKCDKPPSRSVNTQRLQQDLQSTGKKPTVLGLNLRSTVYPPEHFNKHHRLNCHSLVAILRTMKTDNILSLKSVLRFDLR